MKSTALEKIDFAKTHKDLYTASSKIKEVNAEKATFLSVEGKGEPGGPAFQLAIQQMYSLAYTAKFMLKNAGVLDFSVSKLECLWHGGCGDFERTPKSEWRWQLLIRVPKEVGAGHLRQTQKEVQERKQLDTSGVKLWSWKEGRCLQVMHVGPYDQVGKTYAELDAFARSTGLVPTGPAHEIYISDPGRVEPAKLKTIIRLAVTSR